MVALRTLSIIFLSLMIIVEIKVLFEAFSYEATFLELLIILLMILFTIIPYIYIVLK